MELATFDSPELQKIRRERGQLSLDEEKLELARRQKEQHRRYQVLLTDDRIAEIKNESRIKEVVLGEEFEQRERMPNFVFLEMSHQMPAQT